MSIKLLSLFHAFGESDSKILGSVEIINSQLIGTGACLPDFVLTNAMLEHMVDTNDEWIVQRTGVRERRIAKNMHTWELALGAAQDALADAKIDAGELDLILVSTCTPDTNTPNTAAILQNKLGAGAIGAFDINNACTGFVSATDIADCYIKSGKAKTVLVVSAETLSRIVDYTDRGTCILFGDGAAAAVLTNGEAGTPKRCLPSAPRLRDVRCGADGRQYPLLTVGGGTNRNYKPGDPVQDDFYLQMQGREVFKQAVRSLSAVCSELLEDNGLTLEDIDLFIPHQANLRIIEAVGDRLKLESEKIFVNLDEYGNTSAASIPLGIGDACAQGRIRPGSRVLLSAFGGGFTWGAALLEF